MKYAVYSRQSALLIKRLAFIKETAKKLSHPLSSLLIHQIKAYKEEVHSKYNSYLDLYKKLMYQDDLPEDYDEDGFDTLDVKKNEEYAAVTALLLPLLPHETPPPPLLLVRITLRVHF